MPLFRGLPVWVLIADAINRLGRDELLPRRIRLIRLLVAADALKGMTSAGSQRLRLLTQMWVKGQVNVYVFLDKKGGIFAV